MHVRLVLSYLCVEIQDMVLAVFTGHLISCSVSEICLLSSLWESCLAGAGDFLLAGAQQTVWQEIPDVIHRSWRLAFSRALYQLVQMVDTVQIWTVQYKSWPWAYVAKPLGWGKRGLQRNITHRVWPGCWCLCVPGTSIFLVDLPGPERGGFAICRGSQMWRWQETVELKQGLCLLWRGCWSNRVLRKLEQSCWGLSKPTDCSRHPV